LGKPQAGFFTLLGYSAEEAEQIVVELEAVLQPIYRSQGNAERFSERAAKREREPEAVYEAKQERDDPATLEFGADNVLQRHV